MLQIRCPQSLQELWSIVLREGQGLEPEQDIGWQAPGKQGKFTFDCCLLNVGLLILTDSFVNSISHAAQERLKNRWKTRRLKILVDTISIVPLQLSLLLFYILMYLLHRSATYTNVTESFMQWLAKPKGHS